MALVGVFPIGGTLTAVAALAGDSPRGETLTATCAAVLAEILMAVAKAVAATNLVETLTELEAVATNLVEREAAVILTELEEAETSTAVPEQATSLAAAQTSTVDQEVAVQNSMVVQEEEARISSEDQEEEARINSAEAVAQISSAEVEAQISSAEADHAVVTNLVVEARELRSSTAVAEGRTSFADQARGKATRSAEEGAREMASCTEEAGVEAQNRTAAPIPTAETSMEAPTPTRMAAEGAACQMAVALLLVAVATAVTTLAIGRAAAAVIPTRVPQTAAMQVKASRTRGVVAMVARLQPRDGITARSNSRGTGSRKGTAGAETPMITARAPCVQTPEVGPLRQAAGIGGKAGWVQLSWPELQSRGTQRRT